MAEDVIGPAGTSLAGVAAVYRAVGFRSDLVDDLHLVRRLSGEVFVAVVDGRVVGASSCLAFHGSGWIGGVAVLPELARRGIGERLTREAMAALDRRGTATILLHATQMARPLYERMGFRADEDYVEMRGGRPDDRAVELSGLRRGRAADLDQVLDLDLLATGENRSTLVRALWPGSGVVVDDGRVRGFALRQSPTSLGAVIAADDAVGEGLVRASLATATGEQRAAFPASQLQAQRILERLGFERRSRVTRMHLGRPLVHHSEQQFSAFNLYWG